MAVLGGQHMGGHSDVASALINATADTENAIANRVKAVAREARDIPTALGTAAMSPSARSAKNVVRQVTDVAKSAVSGQRQTSSDTYKNTRQPTARQIIDPREKKPGKYQSGEVTVNLPKKGK